MSKFFIYDGDKVLGEVSSAGVVTAAYTWGADGLVSERLPTASPARSLWYQFGPQGETRALTNSAGAVVDSYSYTAYGKAISASGGDANPFQYGGKYGYYSEYNGAVLCGHRWYDTHDTLRWLSRDPIGYNGGNNLYAYCGGDPVGGIDPSGFGSITIKGQGKPIDGDYRSKVGDPDRAKGWPHYDKPGSGIWIDQDGNIYFGKERIGQVGKKQKDQFDKMVNKDKNSNPDHVKPKDARESKTCPVKIGPITVTPDHNRDADSIYPDPTIDNAILRLFAPEIPWGAPVPSRVPTRGGPGRIPMPAR